MTVFVIEAYLIPFRPEVNPLHQFYSVSYLWIACFGTLVSFFVGLLVSLVTGISAFSLSKLLCINDLPYLFIHSMNNRHLDQ